MFFKNIFKDLLFFPLFFFLTCTEDLLIRLFVSHCSDGTVDKGFLFPMLRFLLGLKTLLWPCVKKAPLTGWFI